MSNELIFVVGVFWLTSTAYVIYYHNKHYKLSIETIIWAIFFGPIIALIMKNPEEESTVAKNIEEHIENDKHRKWFRTMGEINRQSIPGFGRTIPPPPPISRVDRARSERDEAIRTARERIQPPNRRPDIKKDFKFFRG